MKQELPFWSQNALRTSPRIGLWLLTAAKTHLANYLWKSLVSMSQGLVCRPTTLISVCRLASSVWGLSASLNHAAMTSHTIANPVTRRHFVKTKITSWQGVLLANWIYSRHFFAFLFSFCAIKAPCLITAHWTHCEVIFWPTFHNTWPQWRCPSGDLLCYYASKPVIWSTR